MRLHRLPDHVPSVPDDELLNELDAFDLPTHYPHTYITKALPKASHRTWLAHLPTKRELT